MPSSQLQRAPERPEGSSRSSTVVLAIILAAQAMAVVDSSVITTALPSLHAALHFSPTGLSWVQNAYTLPFGGLLLLGARAGDLLGRRLVFVAGIALFTVASLFAGLAESSAWLLTARAVQGIAAAVAVNPGIIDTDMLRSCFGGGAGNYPVPEAWATVAADYLLSLGPEENGRSVSVPAV